MRHLGLVWVSFKNPEWKRLALNQAVFRVAKKTLQSLMRKAMADTHLVTDEPFLRVIVSYLNFLFGDTKESTSYWNDELRWNLVKNFFFVGDTKDKLQREVEDVKKSVDLLYIFKELPESIGVEIDPAVLQRSKPLGLFRAQFVIEKNDILCLNPNWSSGLTEHPKAFLLYQQVNLVSLLIFLLYSFHFLFNSFFVFSVFFSFYFLFFLFFLLFFFLFNLSY